MADIPLYGNSFLNAFARTLRGGFTSEEVKKIYINKTLQNFDRPSIMVQCLPEMTTFELENDRFANALKRVQFDFVCFSDKNSEDEFQRWANSMKARLETLLMWIDVEGGKHRARSFDCHIDQDLYMRFHFTVVYSLYVKYVRDIDVPLMIDLEQNVMVYLDGRINVIERNDI